jgi:predicted nucleic acid-binding protein
VLEQAYTELFGVFASLAIPESVYLQAAQLRARFSLRTPDSLHLACAQHHRCEALWTNDNRLAQASHGLARNVLN